MRQQRRGDLVLRLRTGSRRVAGPALSAIAASNSLAHRRQRREQLGAARDQARRRARCRRDKLASRWVTPSIMSCCSGASSSRVFFRSSLSSVAASPTRSGLRAGIGDEIARRKPQFVHAAVDLLGEVADVLQPLQLGKGRIDVADGDDAGHAGGGDDRQQQQETAKGQLADRKRERSDPLRKCRKGDGMVIEPGLQSRNIYEVFSAGEHAEKAGRRRAVMPAVAG